MDDRWYLLVIIDSDETGRKELLALSDGYRESEASWTEVWMDLRQPGRVKFYFIGNKMML